MDATGQAPQRATAQFLLKLTPDELAAIDKAAMTRGMKRAVFVKAIMRAVVKRIDQEGENDGEA